MLRRLVEYVLAQPVDGCGGLLLQDMALCRAWAGSCAGGAGEAERVRALEARVVYWQGAAPAELEVTAGRRQQALLRDALGLVQQNGLGALGDTEVVFLCAAWSLLEGMADPHRWERVGVLLRDGKEALFARRAGLTPAPGLPEADGLVQYLTEADIAQAPLRETRLLAGIELPCRGPVLSAPCHLRVLGDVPERCTVVVEGKGHCCVDGYVMGRVLSKQQCEVRGNISGVAVVLYGDIRARSIINNAQVVAKMGSVHCQSAQGPKLVFAGQRVSVADSVMLGTYIGRKVEVENDVRGARVQVSELVRAKRFRHLGANTVSVVLRRELGPRDFGEVTGAEMNRLLSQAYRLRNTAHHFEAVAKLAERDAERSAQSVLMYLFGGGDAHRKLGSLMSTHRRVEILKRIEENLREILDSARDGLTRNGEEPEMERSASALAPFEDSDPVDEDLVQEHRDAEQLWEQLRARGLDRRKRTLIMQMTAERLERVEAERQRVVEDLEQKERSIQATEPYEKLVQSTGTGASKLEVLQRLLPALGQQTTGALASRLRSSFVTMELRKIKARVRYVEQYRNRAGEALREFSAVTDRLGKDFQVEVLARPEDESLGARAEGCFEEGTRIFLEVMMENPEEQPQGTVIVTEPDDGVRTFIRERNRVKFYARREK